jgi:tetraacyldisaccharide 4'-kinase
MRAPEFWRRSPPTPLARALSPAAALYGVVAARSVRRAAPRADAPTFAIGGPTAGGDGKTPLALALAALLQELGETPVFLTRGYGRKGGPTAPFLVDPSRHGPYAAGDEALLLATMAPTIVGADRLVGAERATKLGATALVLDDGLHSRRLSPDLALGVIDSHYGLGNGLCLPAGPLRAPAGDFFRSVDALVVVGDGPQSCVRDGDKPAFRAALLPEETDVARLCGKRAYAFAGIARPDKFDRSLRAAGVNVVATRWFADHHLFSQSELEATARAAAAQGATLVTTRKDAARISPRDIDRLGIEVFGIRLVFREQQAMESLLSAALRVARSKSGA